MKQLPMTVSIYGASDDLIEVEGDVREEFNAIQDDDAGRGGVSIEHDRARRAHVLRDFGAMTDLEQVKEAA